MRKLIKHSFGRGLLACCVVLLSATVGAGLAPESEPEPPAGEEDAEVIRERAFKLYEEGEHEECLGDLDRYLELEPADAEALNLRSAVRAWLGDWDESLADCDRVIELLPKRAAAWNTRGTVYRQMGDFPAAIDDFRKALELKPKSALFQANIGECYAHMGNEPEAIKQLDLALKLDPDYLYARMFRANCYRVLGDYDKAAAEAAAVLKAEPSLGGVNYQIAELARKQGKLDDAVKLYNAAMEAAPGDFSCRVGRAAVLAHKGDKEAAKADLDAALDEHAERVELYQWRAWSSYELACLYAVRSTVHADTKAGRELATADTDRAFRLLRTSLRRGFASFELLDHDQDLSALRKDERWKDIQVRRAKLEQAEKD